MAGSEAPAAGVRARVDALEGGYEFLLSWAARGLPGDGGGATELRERLQAMDDALDGLAGAYRRAVEAADLSPRERFEEFLEVLEGDARRARSAVRLVLSRPSVSSQLVDNLNASMHLRAVLTDLFLVDEILEPEGTGADGRTG